MTNPVTKIWSKSDYNKHGNIILGLVLCIARLPCY